MKSEFFKKWWLKNNMKGINHNYTVINQAKELMEEAIVSGNDS